MAFEAPVAEILFSMREIAGLDEAILGDVGFETVEMILAEAGRFAEAELAPLNRVGDRQGAVFADGAVTTAPGWKQAFARFAAAGWSGVSASERCGGQDLPVMVEMALQELWNAGSAAFATGPMLSAGAILALEAHASDDLKQSCLPKLAAGTWTATMNLTEPQAGSDLGALTTRAERAEDGSYRITGQKIFISYGEHDLAENIVHLVLARLPDAPAGTRGISMFVVPKFLADEGGGLGARNAVAATGVEHKLGLHGSPTCTMVYDGAVGYLVGEEHRGLACMFTMMNVTRLSVGIQAVGVAERATQEALAYARERRQGRAPGHTGEGMSRIIDHPDVQAMLLRMTSVTAASRAICYACAHAIDMSRRGSDADRIFWTERAALLTPIAKAFASDAGIEVASLGIQVHGGAGYIEETGAAQHLRDVRVFAIYEGTNGIQAIDLVSRKLPLSDGKAVGCLLDDLSGMIGDLNSARGDEIRNMGDHLATALADLRAATDHVMTLTRDGRHDESLAGATSYLRLFGLVLGAGLLAKGVLAKGSTVYNDRMVAVARYFAETILGEATGLRRAAMAGTTGLGADAAAVFSHGPVTNDKGEGNKR
ncbi:acyl-CoA dehydrogenase [Bauldia litoralis]|uniref:3-methylmercaptopropionyl-CoA dehydrogenase n=1 Tax=Bauldia litoralis TaxID=665467 RepID=A0A1G6C5R1_9HYPH|nr:acyl-CoA dehydrogenase [Bauldia litoralis]SDB28181.1 Acyl-CoA dehydrogenase, N-terminal domain [Bauldia litoralis]